MLSLANDIRINDRKTDGDRLLERHEELIELLRNRQ